MSLVGCACAPGPSAHNGPVLADDALTDGERCHEGDPKEEVQVNFTSSPRDEQYPEDQSDNGPCQGKRHEGQRNDHGREYDPGLEAHVAEARDSRQRQGHYQQDDEAQDEREGHHHCGQAEDLAEQHEPAIAGGAELIQELHTASRIGGVVVPADIVQHLAAHPAPVHLALAGHVVAAGDLLRGKAAAGAGPGAVDPGIQELLLHRDPLVLCAGLRTWRVRVAVVVAEGAAAVRAEHLGHDPAVRPCRWRAEPAALGARPQLRVGTHPGEALKLLAVLRAKPLPELVVCRARAAAVIARARAAQLVDSGLLYPEPKIGLQAILTAAVRVSAAARHHPVARPGDVLQTYAAEEGLRRRLYGHVVQSGDQGVCQGQLPLITGQRPPPTPPAVDAGVGGRLLRQVLGLQYPAALYHDGLRVTAP
mmetsp:Transcript_39861/g.89937  ORF Transcript_39861/g.89937 Transcript_39861/m.89937 type:complete len:421 (-) Transcript_39861:50-1312(-)|eukprot:CAMPEP_0197882984 /NCGR_PEP_ID=MMETSP1439-20131203/9959_1 /TAXON_ID=66791 /ORGANISM="Gonyaulax spinifera, Strain CCMP409" /LENGTH=420 /DNA_ID=CAMNT_0043502679 /DNA_START=32 /DNA_END=1294 /DNA_ORIENTATION=-